jgi:hypothetical protein
MLDINAKPASIVKLLPGANTEITYAYGDYPFSNPKQDCEKILAWFNDHFALSVEQAVYELQIGNLSKRISELRQRGYVIHSQRYLAEVIDGNEYHSIVYALHRDMLIVRKMPNPYRETKAWIEEVNFLLRGRALLDLNSDATNRGDIRLFVRLFKKMHAERLGFI